MKKSISYLAALMSFTAILASNPALEAKAAETSHELVFNHSNSFGAFLGGALVGGLIGGAIGSSSRPNTVVVEEHYYEPAPVVVAPAPVVYYTPAPQPVYVRPYREVRVVTPCRGCRPVYVQN